MAKFHGKIGFVTSQETAPGVWTDVVTEREYYGDVLRLMNQWNKSEKLNDDLTINHRVSVTADNFAFINVSDMRYVVWNGVYWKISGIEIQRPRLSLSLGGVYNGQKA